jgi:DNA polymerase-3 subunit alpha (Gram-positive type)
MNPMLVNLYEEFFEKNPYVNRVVAVDVECTDFSNESRIIELGAAGFEFDGLSVNYVEFVSFVNPHMPIPPKIIELTGITDEMVQNAPEDNDVFAKFEEWLTGTKIIPMHNSKFDNRIIRHNFHRVGKSFNSFETNIRCTLEMSKKAKLPITSMKLGEVASHLGYKNEQAHRALADALATLYIYGRLSLGIRYH